MVAGELSSHRYDYYGGNDMKSLAFALVAWMACVSCAVAADDLCSVAPGNCSVLKEDAKVRVLEFTA